MTRQPRGRCPWCGRDIGLRTDALLAERVMYGHFADPAKAGTTTPLCEGSGQLPELELFSLEELGG